MQYLSNESRRKIPCSMMSTFALHSLIEDQIRFEKEDFKGLKDIKTFKSETSFLS